MWPPCAEAADLVRAPGVDQLHERGSLLGCRPPLQQAQQAARRLCDIHACHSIWQALAAVTHAVAGRWDLAKMPARTTALVAVT